MLVDLNQAYMLITHGQEYRLYKMVELDYHAFRWIRIERSDMQSFILALQYEMPYRKLIGFDDSAGGIYVPRRDVVIRRTAERRLVIQGPRREVDWLIIRLKKRGLERWDRVDVVIQSPTHFEQPAANMVAFEGSWERVNTPFEMLLPSVGETWPAQRREPEWQQGQKIKYLHRDLYGPTPWRGVAQPVTTEVEATILAFGRNERGWTTMRIRYEAPGGGAKEVTLRDIDFAKIRPA